MRGSFKKYSPQVVPLLYWVYFSAPERPQKCRGGVDNYSTILPLNPFYARPCVTFGLRRGALINTYTPSFIFVCFLLIFIKIIYI